MQLAAPLLTTRQIIVRVATIIALAEFVIMLAIGLLPLHLGTVAEALLDVCLLVLTSTPLVYFWVIRPFVHARDEALAHISHLAFTDPLTQLLNRRQLLNRLQGIIASCIRHKLYGALLLVDLDGFKPINDIYGHDAGDAVLIEIAQRIHVSIRAEDVASRLGGDEFVILIDHIDTDLLIARDKALKIAEKLINLASSPIDFNSETLQVGASIGITMLGMEHIDAEAAIRKADVAMYRSKQSGKGRANFSE